MVSYISLSPHAFLVGPVQGVQGTRLHNELTEFLFKITFLVTWCGMWFSETGCQWHRGYDRPARHKTSTNPERRASKYSQSPSTFHVFPDASLTALFSSDSPQCQQWLVDRHDPCKRSPALRIKPVSFNRWVSIYKVLKSLKGFS